MSSTVSPNSTTTANGVDCTRDADRPTRPPVRRCRDDGGARPRPRPRRHAGRHGPRRVADARLRPRARSSGCTPSRTGSSSGKVIRPRLGPARRARGCRPAALRAGGRARLPRRRAHRLAGRRHGGRHRRHRLRARRGVPQRCVRLLPRLRDVPARPAAGPSLAACAARRQRMRRARLQPWLRSSTRACSSWRWPRPAGSRSTSSTSCSRDRARCWHLTARASRSTRTFARCPGSSAGGSGVGTGQYPTIEDFRFGQEVVFSTDGRPFLTYLSRSWLLDDEGNRVRPLATEAGFWRPRPGNEIEMTLVAPDRVRRDLVRVAGGHRRSSTRPSPVRAPTCPPTSVMRTASAKEYTAGPPAVRTRRGTPALDVRHGGRRPAAGQPPRRVAHARRSDGGRRRRPGGRA